MNNKTLIYSILFKKQAHTRIIILNNSIIVENICMLGTFCLQAHNFKSWADDPL